MSHYDLAVLGGGTGNMVAAAAAEEGLETALVERGPLGGTCLNRGCNPSKKLIHRADVAETIRNAEAAGIDASLEGVAFEQIVEEVADVVAGAAAEKAERAREHDDLTFYHCEGQFVDDRTVEVDLGGQGGRWGEETGVTGAWHEADEVDVDGDTGGGTGGDTGGEIERFTADAVVLAGGSRPAVPDAIDGTDGTDFLTSDDALYLTELPDRLVVVGGGYIAVEMAHLFSQLGAEVAIVGRGEVLADREDPDVAECLTEVYREKHELYLGYSATEIAEAGGETIVTAEAEDGEEIEVEGDRLLLATGRRPNTDTWNVSAAGIETDGEGFVVTDEFLRTTADGVYAIGDIAGNYMFKHSGDREAACVVETVVHDDETAATYPGMAHAVFGSPQIGSLGRTEDELDGDVDYEVGTYGYEETALGVALRDEGGFAKVLVGDDGQVLGCHVVGPEASTLIHEVSTAVAAGADAETIAETIHVHPALSEVVQGAFRNVRDVAPDGI